MEKEVQMNNFKSEEGNGSAWKQVEEQNIPQNNILGDYTSNIPSNQPLQEGTLKPSQHHNEKCEGNENVPPLLSRCSSDAVPSETEVKIEDDIPADNNADFRKENREFLQKTNQPTDTVSLQMDSNLLVKDSFHEDVEMLLYVCKDEYSESQPPEFYRDKIQNLNENHVYELLKEKDKLNLEFEQTQKKLKENENLITKRLNTIVNILCSSTVLNKFSKLQITDILEKEKRKMQVIKSKLIDSVGCKSIHDPQDIGQNSCSKQKPIEHLNKSNIEINRISKELKKSQDELKMVKVELEDKINTIRQHAHHEQKKNLEINSLEMEVKKFKSQFLHTQKELENASLNQLNEKAEWEQELELFKEKDNLLLKLVNSLRSELEETENELKAVKRDLKDKVDIIEQMAQRDTKELEAEIVVLQMQLAGAQNELTVVERELSYDILTIETKNQQEQELMEKQNNAKVTKLQNQLSATEDELKKVTKELSRKSDKQQKTRQEYEEKVTKLEYQLTKTEGKLEAVTKELDNTVNSMEGNLKREQKLSEVGFREIRMILVKKLGFTDEKKQLFESYMKEETCRGIVSDIRRLIKDMQLCKEPTSDGSSTLQVTENEVHLVVAIACFLKVVPFSASTHFIYSFVAQIDNAISCQHVESLLKKFPTLFIEEPIGTGSFSKKWKYMDLKPIITI